MIVYLSSDMKPFAQVVKQRGRDLFSAIMSYLCLVLGG